MGRTDKAYSDVLFMLVVTSPCVLIADRQNGLYERIRGLLETAFEQVEWIETLKRFVQPDWHDLVAGEWATNVKTGR